MSLEKLKEETLRIMERLLIEVRPSYLNDGNISIRHREDFDKTGMPAGFNNAYGMNDIVYPNDPSLLHYKHPYVGLNSRANKAWMKPEDEDPNYMIEMHGMIIHELTHYYQWTDDPYNERYIICHPQLINYTDYVSQRSELEAHAVQGYFWMEVEDPERLNQLMAVNTLSRVKELLTNYMSSKKNLPIAFSAL